MVQSDTVSNAEWEDVYHILAQAVADFLARKFTNAELYEWMSGVLGEVYSYFLQQATAIAHLAENQMAFDRQDTPPRFIRADYWETPSANGLISMAGQQAPDRQGLTGSVRLLHDVQVVKQYSGRRLREVQRRLGGVGHSASSSSAGHGRPAAS
jgi:hypothetical protein